MTPPHAVHVRIATVDDAPSLLPLFESFYGAHLEPKNVEAVRERMAEASAIDLVLVAELGSQPVGFASLRVLPQIENDRPHAELSDLFVREGHRRHGVGRALLSFAEELARQRGSPRLVVVTAFDNEGARAFYRAVGFEDFALVLQKRLEGAG